MDNEIRTLSGPRGVSTSSGCADEGNGSATWEVIRDQISANLREMSNGTVRLCDKRIDTLVIISVDWPRILYAQIKCRKAF